MRRIKKQSCGDCTCDSWQDVGNAWIHVNTTSFCRTVHLKFIIRNTRLTKPCQPVQCSRFKLRMTTRTGAAIQRVAGNKPAWNQKEEQQREGGVALLVRTRQVRTTWVEGGGRPAGRRAEQRAPTRPGSLPARDTGRGRRRASGWETGRRASTSGQKAGLKGNFCVNTYVLHKRPRYGLLHLCADFWPVLVSSKLFSERIRSKSVC